MGTDTAVRHHTLTRNGMFGSVSVVFDDAQDEIPSFRMSRAMWDELGQPDAIVVTVTAPAGN